MSAEVITSKFTMKKRHQADQPHRCDQPGCHKEFFPSKQRFWKHFTQTHPELVPTDETESSFRERRCEECRVGRDSGRGVMRTAQSANATKNAVITQGEPSSPTEKFPSAAEQQSIQDDISALRLEPDFYAARGALPKRRAVEQINLGTENKSPYSGDAARKTKKHGSGNVMKHRKAADPDYDRSIPHEKPSGRDGGDSGEKRLFNHDRDNPVSFNLQTRKDIKKEDYTHAARKMPIVQRYKNVPVELTDKDSCLAIPPALSFRDTFQESEERLKMVLQPVTRRISPEQLIIEAKGIYSGLIMVEAKCCEVDAKQHQQALEMDDRQPKLNNVQFRALIALHRTLLHEHHDFFLASQHPSASPSLKRLAQKYAMPARMWRHGIHSFLELLRHRLPHSLEHMLTFIYTAYSMMALLYETVPAFEDTWIECLGDLGRYRMAIEDDDIEDRKVYQKVARFWYSKAADKTPYVGRLYHHLAILARPSILQQLFFYCKSLAVCQPFISARESILTVFDPIFNPEVLRPESQPVDSAFVHLHSITFTHVEFEKFDLALESFLDLLDTHISDLESDWKIQGVYMAVCNITSLYQYGSRASILRKVWKESRKVPPINQDIYEPGTKTDAGASDTLCDGLPLYGSENIDRMSHEEKGLKDQNDEDDNGNAANAYSIQEISLNVSKRLGFSVLSLTLERTNDSNLMPHWHTWMVFISHLIQSALAMRLIENEFPWRSLVEMLTEMRANYNGDDEIIAQKVFPALEADKHRPLPEDYLLRGLDWARNYFPPRWFDDPVDDEERTEESSELPKIRAERILWLAQRICLAGDYISYNSETRTFSIHPALENRIEESKKKKLAAAQKREAALNPPTSEEYEAESGPPNYTNSDEEGYVIVVPEKLRKLKEKKRALEAQLQATAEGLVATPEAIAEVSRSAAMKGPEALKKGYTAFIVDTNLLVSYLSTFELIVSKEWSIIVPNSVITELQGLRKNTGSVGDAAKSALITISKSVADQKDVKIITAKGSDVTKVGFFREKLERDEDDESRNIDDIIIRTTRQQAEARRKTLTLEDSSVAEPAILLTEDTNMRVKANARGVTAISTTILKRYLVLLEKTITSSPRSKRKSTRARNDDIDVMTMDDSEDVMELASLPKGITKRRGYKRGRTEGTPTHDYQVTM
jgi:rRNA-processing protein FCF1